MSFRQKVMEPKPASRESDSHKTSAELESKQEVIPTNQDGEELEEETINYPTGLKFASIMFATLSSVFLSSLDENIIGTAIPQITKNFNSLEDVGWYGSAYFLTQSSLLMGFSRAYDLFHIKCVYLFAVALFEIGSLICGLAPNSYTLIIGRAVAGAGSAGINSGFMTIIQRAMPLHKRPVYMSSFSATFGIATVVAPLVGGALTTHVTWRAVFFINIPFGVLSALIIIFHFSDLGTFNRLSSLPTLQKMKRLDTIGTILLLGQATCLLLSLQIASSTRTWSNPRVIGLLVASGVLLAAFVALQAFEKENGILPLRFLRKRSMAGAMVFVATTGAAMNVFEYYLPIWFQAVQGVSALDSGIRILPTVAGWALFSFAGSYGVSKTGYYTPFMIACSVLMSIGCGLITTWEIDTKTATWICLQLLPAAGSGLGLAQAHMVPQTILEPADICNGAGIVLFAQLFGGSIFLGTAENVFGTRLVSNLAKQAGNLNPEVVLKAGAADLRTALNTADLGKALKAYNDAVMETLYIPVGLSVVSLVGALATEWKSVHAQKAM